MTRLGGGRAPAASVRRLGPAALALAALAIAAGQGGHPPAAAQSAGRGPGVARTGVRALARLEPESGLITVGARPGARIERVAAVEGMAVKAGDLLAVLEGHETRQRQLALAEAQRAAAAFKRQARRDELVLEREAFDRLRATRLNTQRGLVDYLKGKVGPTGDKGKDGKPAPGAPAPAAGLGGGMVPPEVRDAAQAQLRAELARAEVQLKEFEVGLELLDRRRALEDRQVADTSPEWAVLDRQVELARTELAAAEVRAPAAGRILRLEAHAGEVSSGPLLALGDVATMAARAEVFQSDVLDVGVGDPAEVTILGRAVAGEIVRVGSVVGRNTTNSLDPTALADRRVVEVLVRLADPEPASRLVGMQVEVAIRRRAGGAAAR